MSRWAKRENFKFQSVQLMIGKDFKITSMISLRLGQGIQGDPIEWQIYQLFVDT